jgi:hypothetical protein
LASRRPTHYFENVEDYGQAHRADEIENSQGRYRAGILPLQQRERLQQQTTSRRSEEHSENPSINATLLACIAAIPGPDSRVSVFITNAENAKKMPATNPRPRWTGTSWHGLMSIICQADILRTLESSSHVIPAAHRM